MKRSKLEQDELDALDGEKNPIMGKCHFCHVPLPVSYYCFGCKKFICRSCDDFLSDRIDDVVIGKHKVEDHRK